MGSVRQVVKSAQTVKKNGRHEYPMSSVHRHLRQPHLPPLESFSVLQRHHSSARCVVCCVICQGASTNNAKQMNSDFHLSYSFYCYCYCLIVKRLMLCHQFFFTHPLLSSFILYCDILRPNTSQPTNTHTFCFLWCSVQLSHDKLLDAVALRSMYIS